jgi:hypothetical protein
MSPLVVFQYLLLFDQIPFYCILLYQSQVFGLSRSRFEEYDVLPDSKFQQLIYRVPKSALSYFYSVHGPWFTLKRHNFNLKHLWFSTLSILLCPWSMLKRHVFNYKHSVHGPWLTQKRHDFNLKQFVFTTLSILLCPWSMLKRHVFN